MKSCAGGGRGSVSSRFTIYWAKFFYRCFYYISYCFFYNLFLYLSIQKQLNRFLYFPVDGLALG